MSSYLTRACTLGALGGLWTCPGTRSLWPLCALCSKGLTTAHCTTLSLCQHNAFCTAPLHAQHLALSRMSVDNAPFLLWGPPLDNTLNNLSVSTVLHQISYTQAKYNSTCKSSTDSEESVCVCVTLTERERESVCVCEKESVCVCVWLCVPTCMHMCWVHRVFV